MFIYVIVCSETLKIYIGQHKGGNLRRYLHQKLAHAARGISEKSHLYSAMRIHPKETWSIHPLISGIEEKSILDDWERHFIRALNVRHPAVGYNICRGGEGAAGRVLSQETRAKIAAAHRGKKHTPESIAKMKVIHQEIGDQLRGIPRPASATAGMHTPEAQRKAKITSAISQTGKSRPDISDRKKKWWVAHPNHQFPIARNQKLSAAHKGKVPLAALALAHDPAVEQKRQNTRFIKTVAWG